MKRVEGVADFFIELASSDENDTITNLRINKLLYFAQGWFLARYNKTLFDEPIEAWKFGPVVNLIYQKYRDYGKNNIDVLDKEYRSDMFDDKEISTLIDIYRYYGKYSTSALVNKTHEEGSPWLKFYTSGEKNCVINNDDIKEYFKDIAKENTFKVPQWCHETAIKPIKTAEDGTVVLPKEEYWEYDD